MDKILNRFDYPHLRNAAYLQMHENVQRAGGRTKP
jgi:hypothetical protein